MYNYFFRSVADRFGVTKSTCWSILYRICYRMIKVNTQYAIICWPSRQRSLKIMSEFERISGIPGKFIVIRQENYYYTYFLFKGIMGSIDGTHIKINKPKQFPNSYVNRKAYHSVLLQAVCDHEKLFTDVFTGIPGSVHDATLFRFSDLSTRMQNGLVEFPNDGHLIGDLAYPLSTKLIVGFKNDARLTHDQQHFNTMLSKARVVIENSFAYLKGRFRRLKYLETVRMDFICLLITTSCILHNVCIMNGDLSEEYIDLEEQWPMEEPYGDIIEYDLPRSGIEKRNMLVLGLHNNREDI